MADNNMGSKRALFETSPDTADNQPLKHTAVSSNGYEWGDCQPQAPTASYVEARVNFTPQRNTTVRDLDLQSVVSSGDKYDRTQIDSNWCHSNTEHEPVWAKNLRQSIDGQSRNILFIREKLDQNAKILENLSSRVAMIESELSSVRVLNEKVVSLEDNVKFLMDSFDVIKADVKNNQIKTNETMKLTQQNTNTLYETQSRLAEAESRSMRENLIFNNIPENIGEKPEELIKSIIRDKLQISESIHFDRVHRVGKQQNNRRDRRPRPIVAKFS